MAKRISKGCGCGEKFIVPYNPFQNGHSYWAAKGDKGGWKDWKSDL